ncbi:GNAT family N-acetyltransferase [Cellulomonas sp. zg-ZUI222]|uniref:GNAT family N-acetyltransferase n=1 Tax=Cellulomonas wangleii TaxID=2816956 RepID=A0ABX8DCB2_9CELL|nr:MULTISPECIES: GNAT family N-acetyltransferase [Cellulomonas]MBO0900389.1 GNAT family N-acetyltransferase [Cellulomonas sp. zg-ZUI22]MBO0922781.1 GNAT family N-acetyltransferase [Cellulomonas wangleii]MBO0926354.1 GNAT family N-acetyltransferase [Cellulomonas wangleii]QVI63962.1 GNAT family N-acetyltransferase [Cellulomonas wangleii]
MSHRLLARLPAALRSRRDVLDQRHDWADAAVLAQGAAAAVLARERPGGSILWALGAPDELHELLPDALRSHGPGVRWATVPRAVPVTPAALEVVGVVPATSWDRFSCDVPPPAQPGEDRVVLLDAERDAAAITACLDVANPTTHARPGASDDAAWWGVPDPAGGRLLGVIGVAVRAGTDVPSMHLHGLGVVPDARGHRLGTALAAVATRRALEGGAPWVSLGMYADNAPARRVYAALGFRVDVENAGYGPPGAARP